KRCDLTGLGILQFERLKDGFVDFGKGLVHHRSLAEGRDERLVRRNSFPLVNDADWYAVSPQHRRTPGGLKVGWVVTRLFVNAIDALRVPFVGVDLVEGDARLQHVDQSISLVANACGDEAGKVLGLSGKVPGYKGRATCQGQQQGI